MILSNNTILYYLFYCLIFQPYMFFGKDVSKIPCFRNSFLYGIIGGFAMGISFFMCTSRTLKSTHFGFGSFVVISSTYW